MKTQFNDGLYTRTTHFGKHKITLTAYRTPLCWNVKASSTIGYVECNGLTAFDAAKSALVNLRLNIPIWSNPNYGTI